MIYRFDDIAYNITTKRVPTPDDNARYIGLEHLDPRELYVKRYGSNVDLKGDKLVMTKGDILFGKRNTYLKRVAIAPFDGLFSAHGMIFHPKEEVIDKRYFPFFINSDAFMDEAIRISVGSLSPTVNWKDLKDLKFDIPPIEKQKQLADKLWIAYDLKSKYANLVESIDEMVKSQFIEMFGTPASNELGLPTKYLNEFSNNLDSKRIPITSGNRKEGPYPYYGASGIVDHVADYIFDETLLLISEDGANLKDRVTPIAFTASGKYWVNNHAHILRFKDISLHNYVEHFINYLNVEKYLTGMAQPKLNQDRLNAIPVNMPSSTNIAKFHCICKQADKSKFELKKSIEAIDKVIKSLINNI